MHFIYNKKSSVFLNFLKGEANYMKGGETFDEIYNSHLLESNTLRMYLFICRLFTYLSILVPYIVRVYPYVHLCTCILIYTLLLTQISLG